jgi:dienelactone hydrolase
MLDIANLADQNGTRVLFYITPVNYQQGERYIGDEFSRVVSKNIDVVKSLLSDQTDHLLLDLSFDLEAFAFVDMEHLREIGKEYVAGRLATAIKPALPAASPNAGGQLTPVPSATATSTQTPRPTNTATPTVSPTPTWTTPVMASHTRAPTPETPTPDPTPASRPTDASPLAGGTLLNVEYLRRSSSSGEYAVDLYRLQYETIDEGGQAAPITAELWVPYVERPTAFPVIVHAAGTTGIGDGCAPLNERALERNWGNYYGHSLTYASHGYVVILPNGLGFDDSDRIHPYFVADLQARVLLDAARAVYALADDPSLDSMLAKPDDAVFFMGYSSGGHAAFATKDWTSSYARELPIKGVIGFGPTNNPETLLREDPVFAPYLVYAYRDFYGPEVVEVTDVFAQRWIATFESDVLSKCVDEIFDYYTRSARTMYTETFSDILYGETLDQRYPLFAEKLDANATGLSGGQGIPVLILQGTADTVVTPDSQRAYRSQLCERGDHVTFLEYPAVAHTDIRRTSFGDVLAWMDQVTAGEAPENHCEGASPSQ